MPVDLNWLDIAALLVIALFSLDGLMKGLVISVLNIAGFFVSIYIAKLMTPAFAEYISKNTLIDESLNKYLLGKVSMLNGPVSPALGILQEGSIRPESILTSVVILVIAFVVIFAAARICLTFIGNILNTAAKLPVIKHFNRLGGLLFGAVKGLLLLYIFFAVLTPVIPVLSPSNPIVAALKTSVFASNFYNYNFVIPWIKGKLV